MMNIYIYIFSLMIEIARKLTQCTVAHQSFSQIVKLQGVERAGHPPYGSIWIHMVLIELNMFESPVVSDLPNL